MNCRLGLVLRLIACFSVTAASFNVGANAAPETDASLIEKIYQNGNSIRLTCDPPRQTRCRLKTVIKGERQSLLINFGDYGLTPDMELLRLYSGGPDYFNVMTSVQCTDIDLELVPTSADVMCFAEFTINEGKLDSTGITLQLIPIGPSIYRDADKLDLDATH